MDYTSFAPGNKSAKPNYNLPELPPPHKPFTHKFLGTLCVVIAIAGAIAYGIWMWGNYISPLAAATPSPSVSADPTAGWQTYTNTKYGFEFKYPAALNLQDTSNATWPFRVELLENGNSLFYIAVNAPGHGIVQPGDDSTSKKVNIGGEQVDDVSRNDQNANEWFLFQHQDLKFEINFSNDSQNIFHQILSTFKFTDPTGQHCGGNIQNAPTCPTGYMCKLNISMPDTGGTCAKN